MSTSHLLFKTWDEMKRRQAPNFFRLYMNPHVAQTCLCLDRYVQSTWPRTAEAGTQFQSFLANSFEEALSGAIKLARYCANVQHRSNRGLVIDRGGRLGHLAGVSLVKQERIEFIPDLVVASNEEEIAAALRSGEPVGFVVLFPCAKMTPPLDLLRTLIDSQSPLLITCVSRTTLGDCRHLASSALRELAPDIVVFDESFVRQHVPFSAFAARKDLYAPWNVRGYAAFHSTTFQPNTVASLHFMHCLEEDDPEFFSTVASEAQELLVDNGHCRNVFGSLYSPSLAKTITSLGLADVRAEGHYLVANGRKIFDGVAGIACSIRGHNPENYSEEIGRLDGLKDYHQAAQARLRTMTGLDYLVPAVSGASAVENALRIGLVAQHPRDYVLALKGGFGGKTLLALTGTADAFYKTNLNPLYKNVVYIDPFSPQAIADLEVALRQYPIGIVQLELIQAVGGVRAVPDHVVHYLAEQRQKWGYLLFVDEVQTGMYRTGPFSRACHLRLSPDLLTIGKGTSDMMFPFAITHYSATLQERVNAVAPDLLPEIRTRHDYEFGYKTLLNTLERAEQLGLATSVEESSALFAERLVGSLSGCALVRDIRVFGLLIAIELNVKGWPRAWLKKKVPSLYILNMLRHKSFPVFIGFCQYEPHVLKLTPPLSITHAEIDQVCTTIANVLRRPLHRQLPALCGVLATSLWRKGHKSRPNGRVIHEHSAR